MVFFAITRFVFYVVHHHQFSTYSLVELGKAFLYGARFDFAVVSVLLIPFWIASHFPRISPKLSVKNGLLFLYLIPFELALLIVFVDLNYFGDAGRRLSYEIFYVRGDLPATLRMFSHYKLALGTFFVSLAGSTWGLLYLAKRFFTGSGESNWKSRTVSLLVGGIAIAIGMRGGLQSKPLRPSFAHLIGVSGLAHLVLNPVYTVAYALKKGDVQVPQFMPEQEAVGIVRDLVADPGATFVSEEYPLLRTSNGTGPNPATMPNVVILLMESWAAKYVGALGSPHGLTPNFDKLAKNGRLFTNVFAISHRSTDGITSTCCGVPTFQDLQIIGSSFEQNNFRCLGTILSEQGYSTLFLHGAKTGSFGLNGFARMAGFQRYIGKEDFELGPDDTDPVWGVYDHVALNRLNEELNAMKKPFLALWFSLTSHSPYHLPDTAVRPVPATVPDHEFRNTIAYSDKSLGAFFDKASSEAYFKNTIFVIVADHTAGADLLGTYERQHIPLLVYAPSLVKPSIDDAVGSQLNVLPTVLDLGGIRSTHHAFSRSLLTKGPRFAFADQGGSYAWFNGSYVLRAAPGQVLGLHDWLKDPQENVDVSDRMPAELEKLKAELYAFVQTSKTAIRENRLAPPQFKESQ